jgi:hypothetical protein
VAELCPAKNPKAQEKARVEFTNGAEYGGKDDVAEQIRTQGY